LIPALHVRRIQIAAGDELAFEAADWRDSIVFVLNGRLEFECGGIRWSLASGAILSLDGLAPRRLENRGREAVLLIAVSRRHAPSHLH
jgi:quercetin dioxygenase-like cupin family protein